MPQLSETLTVKKSYGWLWLWRIYCRYWFPQTKWRFRIIRNLGARARCILVDRESLSFPFRFLILWALTWITIKRIPQIPSNTYIRHIEWSHGPKCTQKSLQERWPPSLIRTNPLTDAPHLSAREWQNARIPYILGNQRAANMEIKPNISCGGKDDKTRQEHTFFWQDNQ